MGQWPVSSPTHSEVTEHRNNLVTPQSLKVCTVDSSDLFLSIACCPVDLQFVERTASLFNNSCESFEFDFLHRIREAAGIAQILGIVRLIEIQNKLQNV